MALVLSAIMLVATIVFWGYCIVKRIKRYVPSVSDGTVRIIKGSVCFLIGLPLFLGSLFSAPKKPDINVLDVLLIIPMMAKSVEGVLRKGVGEAVGLGLTVGGAVLLIWGILEVKHVRRNDSQPEGETDLAESLDDLDRQFKEGLLTEAEYEDRKWHLLCGSGAKLSDPE